MVVAELVEWEETAAARSSRRPRREVVAKGLTLLDERRDFALQGLDAGIGIRHDPTYDAWKQSLAAPKR